MVNVTKIKTLAKEKGLSLTYICQKVGQGAWYLNDVSRGKAPMPPERLSVIADLLDTTPEYLTDIADEKEKAPALSESDLSEEELDLIRMFRSLSEESKNVIKNYISEIK